MVKKRLSSRRTLKVLGALVLAPVLVLGYLISGSASKGPNAAPVQQVAQNSPVWGLRPHPRVTIALPPGQAPPTVQVSEATTVSYGNSGPDPTNFQRPSDQEIRRELHQLHALGLSGGSNGYVNEFAHVQNLVPERIDMGVDYSGTGWVVAIGSGTVFTTNGGGWPGGGFIGITLDSGPYAHLSYFIAECIQAAVKPGQHVTAGQPIGMMTNCGSGIETGWASGNGDEPLAAALHQESPGDPGGWSSAAGVSFDRLLVATGAPSGIPQGGVSHGKMPPGYP